MGKTRCALHRVFFVVCRMSCVIVPREKHGWKNPLPADVTNHGNFVATVAGWFRKFCALSSPDIWEVVIFQPLSPVMARAWRGHGKGMDARVEATQARLPDARVEATQEQLPDGRSRISHASDCFA